MEVFSAFLIISLIRLMVEILIVAMRNNLYLNHYRLPQRGATLELFKFAITIMIAGPIIGTIGAYSHP